MYIAILLILAVLPSIILGWIVYKNDHIEKESRKLLFKLFMGGIASAFLVVIVSLILTPIIPFVFNAPGGSILQIFIYCFVVVALLEEGCKYLFLKKITWNNHEFSHIYDAIVYATFVSLGFATIENILYVITGDLTVAIIRALMSVPAHLFFGIFMGYFYGLSKQAEINGKLDLSKKNIKQAVIVPVMLHGLFDFCLLSQNLLLLFVFLGLIIFLYIKAFSLLKRISKIKENLRPTLNYCGMCGTKLTGNYCHSCGNKCSDN